jgi:hypothetical protein
MKSHGNKTWVVGCVVAFAVCAVSVSAVPNLPFSDFDDGSTQGWTAVEPFGGTLSLVTTGGNPGGWLYATDTVSGGGWLQIAGPPEFSGDLSVYDGVSWDEIAVPQPSGIQTLSITVVLQKSSSERLLYYGEIGPVGVWHSRYVPFDPELWVPSTPSVSFEDVIHDCTLTFNMDCWAGLGPESGIDNIRLVPEPSMGLPGLAVLVLVARRRRMG